MGKKVLVALAILLIWAVVASGLAAVKNNELKQLRNELANYEKMASEDSTHFKELQTKLTMVGAKLYTYKVYYKQLAKKYALLKQQMDEKNKTIAHLRKIVEIYTCVPYGYYFYRPFPRFNNSYLELMAFLGNLTTPKGLNGTKLQAFLEWALKCSGFDAHIAYGEIENEKTGNENMGTWIIVFLKDGVYNIVNKDRKFKVFKSDDDLELKVNGTEVEIEYEPITIFKDIYSAIEFFGKPNMFNWWNVTGFPPNLNLTKLEHLAKHLNATLANTALINTTAVNTTK